MLLESLSKISSHQEAMTVLQKLVIDISNLLSWRKARVEKPPDAVRQESRLPMFSIRKTLKRAKKMPNAKSQRDPPPDYSQDKETVDKELVVQRYRNAEYTSCFLSKYMYTYRINEYASIPSTSKQGQIANLPALFTCNMDSRPLQAVC